MTCLIKIENTCGVKDNIYFCKLQCPFQKDRIKNEIEYEKEKTND